MDDIAGMTALPTSEAPNSTANTPIASMATTETMGYSVSQQQNHSEMYPVHPGNAEAEASGERTISLHELKAMLKQQLEYYFSRENLATDAYLRSQMDSDQYVPIATIAGFNQVRRLTSDLALIVETLRDSPRVQVDDAGEKVRPSQRSIVLILREIPASTPMKDFEELFSGENCPKFSRCEFAHNDTWYVLFDTDEDAKNAYCYLREEAKTFNGKPIMARIKASLTSAPFSQTYKNGVVSPPTSEAYTPQPMTQQQQQSHVQYTTYANVPNEGYNNQQQICPPFYPPTMLQAWAPTTATCVDLAAVFSMNGLSPQAAYRPLSSTSKNNYPTRDRPVKSFNTQQTYANRNDQNSRYYNRNQSFLPRQQQQQQQAPFHNVVNASNFDYLQYQPGSRNIHFGFESLNFFGAPNLCFRKLPGHSYASQSRHSPLVLPRNAIGISAINTPDQSYIPVGGGGAQFTKDSSAAASSSKSGADSQGGKENWAANQKQRNKKWSKENGATASSKSFPETSGDFFSKPVNGSVPKSESPKFDLETTSFPPLPGCMDTDVLDVDVYESRLSDIVKGTVKSSGKDSKPQTTDQSLAKDISTLSVEAAESSDGAFSPPASMVPEATSLGPVASETVDEWDSEPLANDTLNENSQFSTSISCTSQTPNEDTVLCSASTLAVATTSTNSASLSSIMVSPVPVEFKIAHELESSRNVPNENEKPAKAPKAKQTWENVPKRKSPDLPSPKNKMPEGSSKGKGDSGKENKTTGSSKHRASASAFSANKVQESSVSKEKAEHLLPSAASEVSASKNSDSSASSKDKNVQGHAFSAKGHPFELPKVKKQEAAEPPVSLLSVNGHIDSESTVSSEDEKTYRKLTYSEVAIRAKDRVEKLAQELKEKERQEAIVRHHRQQEITSQGGPFREFPRRVGERPGSKDWRERRKPPRTVPLPSSGQ